MAAKNSAGTGPDSGASAPVTPTASAYTNAVFSDDFESGSLSAWTQTLGTGSAAATAAAADHGVHGLRLANAAGQATLEAKTLPQTVDDSSTRCVGTGAQSAAGDPVTPAAPAVPGAPGRPTGAAGDKSITLTWTAPGSDGGSAITGYRITPSVGTAAQTPIDTGSTSTSRTITQAAKTIVSIEFDDGMVEGYVTQAEQHGGGWVQLVFHDMCSTGCTGDDYSTTPAMLGQFLDWLQPRAANGTVTETVNQALDG